MVGLGVVRVVWITGHLVSRDTVIVVMVGLGVVMVVWIEWWVTVNGRVGGIREVVLVCLSWKTGRIEGGGIVGLDMRHGIVSRCMKSSGLVGRAVA